MSTSTRTRSTTSSSWHVDASPLAAISHCTQVTGRLSVDTHRPDDHVVVFLSIEQMLWSKHGGKLRGHHTWPFAVALPARVKLQSRLGRTQLFELPRSFAKAHAAEVRYEVAVRFHRTLRADHT